MTFDKKRMFWSHHKEGDTIRFSLKVLPIHLFNFADIKRIWIQPSNLDIIRQKLCPKIWILI